MKIYSVFSSFCFEGCFCSGSLSLNILLFLAVYFPWELGSKADALASAPSGIKPEWYFMFMFQTLKLLPPHILFMEGELVGVLGFGIAGFIWMIYPFLSL